MESIDLLYLNSAKALELNEPQAHALLAWLQNGGHLVVGVEQISDITGNPWLRDLMPCDLTDDPQPGQPSPVGPMAARSLDQHPLPGTQPSQQPRPRRCGGAPGRPGPCRHRRTAQRGRGNPAANPPPVPPPTSRTTPQFEAAPLPMLTGTMRDGAVLIGDDAAPLAVTAERGRGRITVLTFSPEREPFVSWKNRGWFWAKLAEIPLARLTSSDNPMQHGAAEQRRHFRLDD